MAIDSIILLVYAYVIIFVVLLVILSYILGNVIGERIIKHIDNKKREAFFILTISLLPDEPTLKDILDIYSVKMATCDSRDHLKYFLSDIQCLKVKILERNLKIIPKDIPHESIKEWVRQVDNLSNEFEKEHPFIDLNGEELANFKYVYKNLNDQNKDNAFEVLKQLSNKMVKKNLEISKLESSNKRAYFSSYVGILVGVISIIVAIYFQYFS